MNERRLVPGGVWDLRLGALGLLARTENALGLRGVATVGDLLSMNDDLLLALRGFGVVGLQDVKARLRKQGLRLGDRPGRYGKPDLRLLVRALLRRIEWYGGHGLCGACYRGPRKGHLRGCLMAEIRALVDGPGGGRR